MRHRVVKTMLIIASFLIAGPALAQEQQRRPDLSSEYKPVSSTELDFTETLIDGQMRAPTGFFLQGRKGQSLSQMVRLRSNFKRELRNSRYGMKAAVN